MHSLLRSFFTRGEILRDLIFLACLVAACLAPRFANSALAAIEAFGSRLAGRKLAAIVWIAVVTIVLRLSLLWLFPIPYPQVHDEFSYLLAADTFTHGRLANPPHPMWIFFDTIHVNQQPAYMSKYPPAQGAMLAVGQLIGSPWIGVLLSGGLMCAAVLWMLQGWLPTKWALVGGVLVMFKLAICSYWMNSYYGGFVPAIGGALVTGALPRILHHWRAWDSLIMGLGALLLANSRPFEGAFVCLPVFVFLLWRLYRRRRPSWRIVLERVVVPLLVIAILGGAFMAYYNWRGTGSATVFPYALNEKTYQSLPTFSWQTARPALHYGNPQLEAFYSGAMREAWAQNGVNSLPRAVRKLAYVLTLSMFFFLWPTLAVSLLALFPVLRDHRIRLLVVQAALVFLSFLLVRAWFHTHYAAPLVATIFTLVTQAMRHIRRWEFTGRPVGVGITRVMVVFTALLAPFNLDGKTRFDTPDPISFRAEFTAQLEANPGQHLVIVQCSPHHNVFREWVYNGADIDHAKVVWARELPGISLQPLLEYFRGRQVWLAEPDTIPPQLARYESGKPN
jgi:hypothetical protein